jgi:hypothetical protein
VLMICSGTCHHIEIFPKEVCPVRLALASIINDELQNYFLGSITKN